MNQILLLAVVVSIGEAANILGVFAYPSESHHILGSILLGNLAKKGHNVTFISPFPTKPSYPNFIHLIVEDILTYKEEHIQKTNQKEATILGNLDRFKGLAGFQDHFYKSRAIQSFLNSNSQFDLMIHFAGVDATLALAHHFDVPVILFTPYGGFSFFDGLFGNPVPLAYVPGVFVPFSDDMNFFQRLANVLVDVLLSAVMSIITSTANDCIQRYLPGAPSIEDVRNRVEMILINTHVSTETPRPYLPAMVQIGGFHLQEPEHLPEDLKKILDDATTGVVYFSFGTNVKISDLSEDKLNIIIRSLGQLPLKVLIKFDKDTLDNRPDNIEIRTWYPQRGILSHPNVKLFINHGGYGGCTESLYHGVPMICIPFFLDQPKNCADVERHGYGIHLSWSQITAETFGEALKKVLYDEKFISKAKLKSELYRDQEMNPMDRAAYWVNHVIKHKGAKHLRAKALDLAWYQYYLLDIMAFMLSAICLLSMATYYILKCGFNRIFRRQQKIKAS